MAYTPTITKRAVRHHRGPIYTITLNISISDESEEVFNQDVTVQHNENTGDLATFMASVQEKIRAQWDEFIAEQGILNLAALDNAVSTLTTQLTTYINS